MSVPSLKFDHSIEDPVAMAEAKNAELKSRFAKPVAPAQPPQQSQMPVASPPQATQPNTDFVLPDLQQLSNEAAARALLAETPPPADPVDPNLPPAPPIDPDDDEALPPEEKQHSERFRTVRRKAKELETKLQEREARLAEIEQENLKYKSGEIITEQQEQQQNRIKELERYEHLHNFRLSREYKEKYAEPFDKAVNAAKKLATDYNVPPQVVNEALGITDKRQLNSYLRTYFDDVGALEVRAAIDTARQIQEQAHSAEQEPAQAFEQIKQERQEQERVSATLRVQQVQKTARTALTDALVEIGSSEEYPELIIRQGDEKHNALSRAVVESAAKEYGKLVTAMAAAGMQEVPPAVAKILAKRFLLSEAAGVMAASRAEHARRADQVIQNNQRRAPMMRPQVGSVAPDMGSAQPQRQASADPAATIRERARETLKNVGLA
jgi:hypothetical protein